MSHKIQFSTHAKEMLSERRIFEEWIWLAINSPDTQSIETDGNIHYLKKIQENQGRILRVVVNSNIEPNRIVTVFFDRRLRRKR